MIFLMEHGEDDLRVLKAPIRMNGKCSLYIFIYLLLRSWSIYHLVTVESHRVGDTM